MPEQTLDRFKQAQWLSDAVNSVYWEIVCYVSRRRRLYIHLQRTKLLPKYSKVDDDELEHRADTQTFAHERVHM